MIWCHCYSYNDSTVGLVIVRYWGLKKKNDERGWDKSWATSNIAQKRFLCSMFFLANFNLYWRIGNCKVFPFLSKLHFLYIRILPTILGEKSFFELFEEEKHDSTGCYFPLYCPGLYKIMIIAKILQNVSYETSKFAKYREFTVIRRCLLKLRYHMTLRFWMKNTIHMQKGFHLSNWLHQCKFTSLISHPLLWMWHMIRLKSGS